MKKLITASLMFTALPLLAASPAGEWITYDEHDKPEGRVKIFKTKDAQGKVVYDGTVGESVGKNKGPTICQNCPAPYTGKPIKGLDFLKGFEPTNNPNKFEHGHVLDPLTGNMYNASMTLCEDGKTLVFRGFMGISMFGADRTWKRSTGKTIPAYTHGCPSSQSESEEDE